MSEQSAGAPTPKKRFQRAEASARTAVILLGGGVMAFFVGGVLASGLSVRVLERVGAIESPLFGFVLGWFLQRVWLWFALPAIGWVVGRFLTRVKPLDFAVTAALTGEAFGMLLSAGVNGVDFLFVSVLDAVARVVTFIFGLWLTKLAIDAGQASNGAAQARANVLALARKAEYAEFVARSGGPPEP